MSFNLDSFTQGWFYLIVASTWVCILPVRFSVTLSVYTRSILYGWFSYLRARGEIYCHCSWPYQKIWWSIQGGDWTQTPSIDNPIRGTSVIIFSIGFTLVLLPFFSSASWDTLILVNQQVPLSATVVNVMEMKDILSNLLYSLTFILIWRGNLWSSSRCNQVQRWSCGDGE